MLYALGFDWVGRRLRGIAPEIVDVTRRLLAKVRAGELGRPPGADMAAGGTADEQAGIRAGWL